MFGANSVFLQSITDIPDDEAIKYMTAANLSVTSVTKAAASATQKLSRATPTDLEKVSNNLCHTDNIAVRDLDSASVNAHIAKAIALDIGGSPATMTEQYQFLTQNAFALG